MSWAKIDDQITHHPKFIAAGNEAIGAWIRLLAYSCARLTDGLIARHVALSIAPKKTIDRLVAVRLFDLEGDDYRIHDFHDWNPPAANVLAKRALDKTRKASGRKGQGRGADGRITGAARPPGVRADNPPDSVSPPSGVPPVPVPVPVPNGDPPGSPPENPNADVPPDAPPPFDPATNETHDGQLGYLCASWRDGVSSVTGRPMSPLMGAQLRAFLAAAATHGPKDDPIDWAYAAGAEYAHSAPTKLWAMGFQTWLDSGKQPERGRQRTVQPADDRAWTPPEGA